MMDYAVSVRPMLDMLTHGSTMRSVMGRFVQVFAVLVGCGLLLSWIGLWTMVGTLGPWGALALTFTQVILLAAFIKVVQVMWVRGEDIRNLPDSDFTMMSIFATIVRLPGEAAFIFYVLFSVPAMFLVWGGATQIVAQFGVPLFAQHAALSGVLAFITCWVVGFGAWVTFSLLAEIVSALYSIAHDLRCTRRTFESGEPAHSPTTTTHARAA